MSRQETGAKWGWYGGMGGGSLWMIGTFVGAAALGWYGLSLAVLLAIVVDIALILYLPPWRHPNVPLWKLIYAMFGYQIAMAFVVINVTIYLDPLHQPVMRELLRTGDAAPHDVRLGSARGPEIVE